MKTQVRNDEVRREVNQPLNEESRHSTNETDNQRSTCINEVQRLQVNATIYLTFLSAATMSTIKMADNT